MSQIDFSPKESVVNLAEHVLQPPALLPLGTRSAVPSNLKSSHMLDL